MWTRIPYSARIGLPVRQYVGEAARKPNLHHGQKRTEKNGKNARNATEFLISVDHCSSKRGNCSNTNASCGSVNRPSGGRNWAHVPLTILRPNYSIASPYHASACSLTGVHTLATITLVVVRRVLKTVSPHSYRRVPCSRQIC